MGNMKDTYGHDWEFIDDPTRTLPTGCKVKNWRCKVCEWRILWLEGDYPDCPDFTAGLGHLDVATGAVSCQRRLMDEALR
jgi:hypothetical protein